MDWLPAKVQDINFTGLEVFHYTGEELVNGVWFRTWTIEHSLNDWPIRIYMQANEPRNWIAFSVEPATQNHPDHYIVFWITGMTQHDRDLLGAIADKPVNTYTENSTG
jgi:hypothetical protein